jgi:hypothetical protein
MKTAPNGLGQWPVAALLLLDLLDEDAAHGLGRCTAASCVQSALDARRPPQIRPRLWPGRKLSQWDMQAATSVPEEISAAALQRAKDREWIAASGQEPVVSGNKGSCACRTTVPLASPKEFVYVDTFRSQQTQSFLEVIGQWNSLHNLIHGFLGSLKPRGAGSTIPMQEMARRDAEIAPCMWPIRFLCAGAVLRFVYAR